MKMATEKKQKMASIEERLKPDTMLKIIYDSADGSDEEEEPPRFIIAYWSIRGLAAPIRAMLSAAQINHKVALYDEKELGETAMWDMKSYVTDKKWLREEFNAFMNLPFLVDCHKGIVIAQTNAIFLYLSRELNMCGKDSVQQAKIDEMMCETMDFRDKMVAFAYRSDGSKEKAHELLKNAKAHIRKFEAHLAEQYPDYFKNMDPPNSENAEEKTAAEAKEGVAHLIPGIFTAPDFHLWEMLDQYEGLARCFDLPLWAEDGEDKNTAVYFHCRPDAKPADRLYPYLEEFRNTFMSLPENAHYIGSFLHNEIPCNNPTAVFASTVDDFKPYTRGQEAPWRAKGEVLVRCKKVST